MKIKKSELRKEIKIALKEADASVGVDLNKRKLVAAFIKKSYPQLNTPSSLRIARITNLLAGAFSESGTEFGFGQLKLMVKFLNDKFKIQEK